MHGVSAIRSEGSLATGYARFESCIFESNRGQYTIYLVNAQAIFNNCIWYNNGLHLPADPVITNGVDVYLEQGNQQITKFEGCSFGTPASDAVDWTSINIGQSEANLVSVENCYGNGDGIAKYFITTNSPNPASLSVKASRWVDYTSSTPILGVGVDMVNNLSQNGQSVVNNQIASLTTTDDIVTKIWGGTYWGPLLNYPNAPAIVMYEAKVSGGDASGAVYYSNIVREVFKVTESAGAYTFTSLGNINETPVSSGGTMNAVFQITNNSTAAAGVKFSVRGMAATNVMWTTCMSVITNKQY